jgi:hypothetical protein
MMAYIDSLRSNQTMYSFTISWNRKDSSEKHTSYFSASTEAEAERKFLHEKNKDDYNYVIVQNPIS